jgi:hypothetical protein
VQLEDLLADDPDPTVSVSTNEVRFLCRLSDACRDHEKKARSLVLDTTTGNVACLSEIHNNDATRRFLLEGFEPYHIYPDHRCQENEKRWVWFDYGSGHQLKQECTVCGRRDIKATSEEGLKQRGIDPETLPKVQTFSVKKCERCTLMRPVQRHHWAPRRIFGQVDSDTWPTSNLCPECHELWHTTLRDHGLKDAWR